MSSNDHLRGGNKEQAKPASLPSVLMKFYDEVAKYSLGAGTKVTKSY